MNHRELIAALTPRHGRGEARAIVRLVMEERFGLSQTDLLMGRDESLTLKERTELEKIASRLVSGEPVQHVLGYATFCGRRFGVSGDVLVPRPETEELVRWVLDDAAAAGAAPSRLLDLGTGSGCIALSLACELPSTQVLALDISEAALGVARRNAAGLGLANVEFLRHDMSLPLPAACGAGFDAVVSNPPYVRRSEAAEMTATVLDYEPHLALFVPDDDPLCFYRAIARQACRLLTGTGAVYVELNSALAEETAAIFRDNGLADTALRRDQFGRWRMLRARRQVH